MQALNGVGNFTDSGIESCLQHRSAPAMIHRAERLEPSGWSHWGEYVDARAASRDLEQASQKFGRDLWHIARNDNIPFGAGLTESGQNSTERALTGVEVADDRIAQGCVSRGVADQRALAGAAFHFAGDGGSQGLAVVGKHGFVASHAGTAAAYQYKSGDISGLSPGHTDHDSIDLYGLFRARLSAYIALLRLNFSSTREQFNGFLF
jgi:hypothetical protein